MEYNTGSQSDEYHGLSEDHMLNLMTNPLGHRSPLFIPENLSPEVFREMLLFRLVLNCLERMNTASGLRLASNNGVPPEFTAELLRQGFQLPYPIPNISSTAIDSSLQDMVQSCLKLCKVSGLTTQAGQTLLLTDEGKKLAAPGQDLALFKHVFRLHQLKYPIDGHDEFLTDSFFRLIFPLFLYLVTKFGATAHTLHFYVAKIQITYPGQDLPDFSVCARARFLDSYLSQYGLIEYPPQNPPPAHHDYLKFRTTPLFRRIFKLNILPEQLN